jgi:hypothetical protein
MRKLGKVAWAVLMVAGGVAAMYVLFGVLVMGALLLGGGMGEGNRTEGPVWFWVRVQRTSPGPIDLQLHLDPVDATALGIGGPLTGDANWPERFDVPTPYVSNENSAARYHCLSGAATVVDRSSGSTVATIPAGTCIGEYELVVPTAEVPDLDAELEGYGTGDGSFVPTPLAGPLVVGIDGCATIGGVRVGWPRGAYLDGSGTVHLPDGRLLANGSEVEVTTRGPASKPPIPERCPQPTMARVAAEP